MVFFNTLLGVLLVIDVGILGKNFLVETENTAKTGQAGSNDYSSPPKKGLYMPTQWSAWSQLSVTCGVGQVTRTRKCQSINSRQIVDDKKCGQVGGRLKPGYWKQEKKSKLVDCPDCMKHPCPGCDFPPGHVSNSVCGSDGKTYEDDCKLAAANCGKCVTEDIITFKHKGECKGESKGDSEKKGKGARKKNGKIVNCIRHPCPWCEKKEGAVCGSDGKTYEDNCKLASANCDKCLTEERISFKHKGECKGGSTVAPQPPSLPPGWDIEPTPKAPCPVCEEKESKKEDAVCGSDGITYKDSCSLATKNCDSATLVFITIEHKGECKGDFVGSWGPCSKTCGVGLQRRSLRISGKVISQARTCNRQKCRCPRKCNQVCGTDWKTYCNKCFLEQAARETGKKIRVKYTGKCYRGSGSVESSSDGCFTGASTVQTRQGVLPINQLVLGDSVLTISSAKGLTYTEFLGWLHRDANVDAKFLKISTDSTSIGLTPSHLIFRTSVADGSLESVFANEIEEGDKLVSWKGSKMTEEEVVAVEHIGETGVWAPLTTEGTLLVDDLLASCYAAFPHSLSDLALAPVKMFPTMLLDDQQSLMADGKREVVKLLRKMGTAIGLEQREGNQTGEKENLKKGGNPLPALAAVGASKNIEL